MANGNTATEIKALLAQEGEISTEAALRLSLDLQVQMFERFDALQKKYELLDKRLEIVEKDSIILWISHHPKLAIAIVVITLTLMTLVDVRDVLALVMGLK